MQNLKLLFGVVGGTVAMVLLIAYLFSSQEAAGPRSFDLAVVQGDMRHTKIVTPSEQVEDDQEASPAAVLARIVEFSDFQCPACRAVEPLFNQILNQYPGQVELVYRHLPLESIHKNARLASIASEYMADQGFFWEFHDVLYEKQPEWADLTDPTETFATYAAEFGVDRQEFVAGLADPKYDQLVETDLKDAFALGAQGTPTIFVNGFQVSPQNLAGYVAGVVAQIE